MSWPLSTMCSTLAYATSPTVFAKGPSNAACIMGEPGIIQSRSIFWAQQSSWYTPWLLGRRPLTPASMARPSHPSHSPMGKSSSTKHTIGTFST